MPTPAWPLIEMAIEPNSEADRKRLDAAILKLAAEESCFSASTDQESGQTLLKGASELHLDAIVGALKHTHKVKANVGAPQVAYREKLGRAAIIDHTHKRQTGSSGQFARVKIEFEPGKPGAGFVFKSAIAEGAVPTEYVPGVEKGLNVSKDNGLLAGFPVIDFTATLINGAYHDLDSSALTFQIASQAAFRELKDKADPRLLQPIMKLEVASLEEHVDVVIRDLRSRRAIIQSQDKRGGATIIHALTPLSNLLGYANTLRRFSHGGAAYKMKFSHVEEVPLAPRGPDLPPAAAAALRA